MSAVDLTAGPAVRSAAFVARANPVAKLVACAAISLGLLITVDVVTAATALLLQLLCLPATGVSPRLLLRRGWVILLAALPVGVMTTWLGTDSGAVLLTLGPVTVSEGSLIDAAALVLRILAIGLPSVVLLLNTDPTDLADALAQVLRLPHRFVVAGLAGLRLFSVMAAEWQQLSLARRARGLGEDGWWGSVRTSVTQAFVLLVLAVRRASTLATAMEARGFGATPHRTWARTSRLRGSDVVVMVGAVVLVLVATTAGVLSGTWSPTGS